VAIPVTNTFGDLDRLCEMESSYCGTAMWPAGPPWRAKEECVVVGCDVCSHNTNTLHLDLNNKTNAADHSERYNHNVCLRAL
jgi:hypothetical protein